MVLVLYNPASGTGKGRATAESACSALETLGKQAAAVPIPRDPEARAAFLTQLADAELLVIAGGDGTVHHVLADAVAAQVPIYHLPLGTENLFARQFRTFGGINTLTRAIAGGNVAQVDLGRLLIGPAQPADTPPRRDYFAIMVSIGPDASVVRRLAAIRTGPISHLSYIRPSLAEFIRPWLPHLSIEVDGRALVTDQPGMLVVANSRQYAARVDHAIEATMTDGLLDVVFMPSRGPVSALGWFASSRLRLKRAARVYARAKHVVVTTAGENPTYQVDGECGRPTPAPMRLELDVHAATLNVLCLQSAQAQTS